MASKTTTFPLDGPVALKLRLGHGSISVAAKDDLHEAVVRLSPRSNRTDILNRVTVEMREATLMVTGPRQGGLTDLIGGLRRERDRIDTLIEVPTGTAISIAAASEAITVTGHCGDTDIATGSARITLDTVAGNLRLRYGNGNARISAVTGTAQLSAGNGMVHFGDVGGALEWNFGRGELVVDAIHGGVRGRAGAASTQIGAAYGDVDVAFGSGPISVGVPTSVSARVDIATGTGQVRSDFPVEQTATTAARTISVRARTGRGDIHLRRAAA
jgi:hypothetical protein